MLLSIYEYVFIRYTDNVMDILLTTPKDDEKQLNRDELIKQEEYTVLYFYPKDDTPGCTVEAQEFTQLRDEFEKVGTQVIGVSKDPSKKHCKFRDKYGLSIALISDPDFVLHEHFSRPDEDFLLVKDKSMYGKTYRGTVRSTVLIDKT